MLGGQLKKLRTINVLRLLFDERGHVDDLDNPIAGKLAKVSPRNPSWMRVYLACSRRAHGRGAIAGALRTRPPVFMTFRCRIAIA